MGDKTGIEWTDATWNPVVGCTIVSPGCTNCYAMTMAGRIERMNPASHYAGTTKPSKAGAVWTGKMAQAPESILLQPLSWKRPRRIFVNSMSDLFHDNVPDEWIDRVFAVMALAPQHTFQVLTKRSARMRSYLSASPQGRILDAVFEQAQGPDVNAFKACKIASNAVDRFPLANVWLGVSAEDQAHADERIPDLLATPATVRFVSAEPLLGPINFELAQCNCPWPADAIRTRHLLSCPADRRPHRRWSLDWIIVGGESGPGARPMHPDWARSIRDQCEAAGVAFFFKQVGEWAPDVDRDRDDPDRRRDYSRTLADRGSTKWLNLAGGRGFHGERFHVMRRLGKGRAGRLLDGRTHDALPEIVR